MSVVLSVAGLAAFSAPALAATAPSWGAAEANLPAALNPAADPGADLTSVSCPSVADCSAVGTYKDNSGHTQGLLFNESNGVWSAAQPNLTELSPNTDPSVSLRSVSCASPGDCSAVGYYEDSSSDYQGLLLSETNGVWSAAKANISALGPAANPFVGLNSVSCASAGDCSAVGTYEDSSHVIQGLLLTETNGVWSASEANLSGLSPNPNPIVSLDSVSCTSAGDCSAVGSYADSTTFNQGLLLTETNGVWSAAKANISALSPATNPAAFVNSVSCTSAGDCSAVGSYHDTSGTQGLLLTETNGVWSAAKANVSALSPATNPGVSDASVSCRSAGNCSAVGSYIDSAGHLQGLLMTQTSGVWSAAEANLSGLSPAASPGVTLNSVSCGSVGNCSAVGYYSDSSGHFQGLLLTQTSGLWSTAQANLSGLSPDTNPGVDLTAVSCVSTGACSAVGYYEDSSAHLQGLLLGRTANPSLSVSAPAAGVAGSPISAGAVSAVLAGGFAPTGTLSFRVFGPQATAPSSCTSGGTVIPGAGVAGNGSVHPGAGFTPSSAGDYWWSAVYSGDVGNHPAASACGAGMAETAVSPLPDSQFTTVSVKVNPRTGAITFTEAVKDSGRFSYGLTFPNGRFGSFSATKPHKNRCARHQIKLKGKCLPATVRFGSGSKTSGAAGKVTFTVKPSANASKALKYALQHRKTLSVTATLTYRSARGGTPTTHSRTVRDKLAKPKPKRKHKK